jgi:hypothetical protein
MKPMKLALVAAIVLAGCGGPNPFLGDDTELPPGEVDPTDPNVSVNNQFAFDRARNLTLNRVTYDEVANELVINNLPFDGPEGIYTQVAGAGASTNSEITRGIYESQQTSTTGLVKYYAAFVTSDYLEASAAAGVDWSGFGYAGANINRDSFRLPAGDEYVFQGIYAGTRKFSKGSGIELVVGDVELLLDVLDLDPDGNVQGLITGTVFNRQRVTNLGTNGPPTRTGGRLPNISLLTVSFDRETGTWEAGDVETSRPSGDIRDSGTYNGILAGPAGEEIGGFVVMEGVADVQRTVYETVAWSLTTTETVPIIINGIDTGFVQDITTVTNGNLSGLDQTSQVALQQIVDSGGTLPSFLPVNSASIPAGAVITERLNIPLEFTTDFNAREVGVFIGDVVVP